ncbi:uncharacterized protein PHACADRAFT_26688 [Phanerochaete carnosa HHB-10118-sp]|uniref:Uncharacterized protein n=1 Tax=Phanerochaete carnosa (strain HHB-10118-sp) TaxID=650164 RepID=K5X5M7_PHACS|nr:uncharacterized protein PHACADRAFT_26688 [Phanerochaete carnosa HHB-10118-sp]EKM58162.1 hypothetical protein PHACADRAFT_26688 [Phanerochaete carnosa HHB-10118-sp]
MIRARHNRPVNRPYTLWAAAFVGTVLAVLITVGHVLATLKNFAQLPGLLRGPVSTSHGRPTCPFPKFINADFHFAYEAWLDEDRLMNVHVYELDEPTFGDIRLTDSIHNETEWKAPSTHPVAMTHRSHCFDFIHAGYVTHVGDRSEHVEECSQYLVYLASFIDATLENEELVVGGSGGRTADVWDTAHKDREGVSWTNRYATNDHEPAVLQTTVHA